jgi:hypothetical protein
VSFEFHEAGEPRYLVLSVEARRGPGEPYLPLLGMFRQYTKIYVLATEQDVIGLRSHVVGERVLLYPVNGSQARLETFLLAVLSDANALYREPEFYNTILDNCLTNLIKHSKIPSEVSTINFKVLLPGRVDRLTYALNITRADSSFESARKRATVNPALRDVDDPSFSASLRCAWEDTCASLN